MRKNFILLSLVLVMALLAGTVMAQDDLESVDPSGQTIVYWHQFTESQAAAMTQIVDTFNANNEWGITVEMAHQGSYNDIREQMNAAIISGETPNVLAGYANDAASYFADEAVVDLTPYVASPTWGLDEAAMADLNQGVLAANRFEDGTLLAWGHQNSAQTLVVNMTMLGELGFDAPPATFEDFSAISCAAAELTGPNGEDVQGFPLNGDSSEFEAFVASMGGSIYHDGAFDFTSNASVGTLQLFQDLYNQGCAYIPAERFGNTADFALGLNPMATTSSAGFPFIIDDIEESGSAVDWIATTLPSTEGNRTLQVYVPSVIVAASTPEQQLASWLFVKYLTSPEAGVIWGTQTGYFSPSISANEMMSEDAFANPAIIPYYEETVALQNDPEINIYTSPSIAAYGSVRGLVAEAIASVVTGGVDPATAAQTLQDAADAALADSM